MDWTTQSEEMLKSWTEVQKKMWDAWLAGVRETGRPSTVEAWQQAITRVSQSWLQSVGRALDAQVEWTRIWAESLGGERSETTAWARQFVDSMQRWVDWQKQLWETWFEMARKFGPDGFDVQEAWTKAWSQPTPAKSRSGV